MTAKQVLLTWGRVARVTAPAVEQCLDVAGDLRLPCVSSAPLHADTVLHSLLAKHDVHAGLTARAFKQLLKMQQEETMVPIRVQAAGDGALVQVIVDDPLPTPTASMRHLGELYARHVLLQALDDGWQPLHDDRHAADPSPAADPTSGHADPQPSPSPVDSILHEQTKTLNDRRTTAHAPLACGTEPAPLGIEPATGDNVIYTLWQDGALNVLVRSTHGVLLTAAKKAPKPPSPPPTSVAIVHAKLEYQSHEGCEQLTFTELSDAWADCFLARNTAPLLRVRMDAATLRVMHMEHLPAEHVLPNQTPFRPNMAMKNLHLLLDRLRSFPAGDYLLRRQLDESHVTILKATPTGKGSFDLRATTGATTGVTTGVTATAKAIDPTAVFWIPIDPNIVLDRHRATGRLPCTFVARPAESSAFGMTLRSRKESPRQAAGKKRKKKKKGKVKRA